MREVDFQYIVEMLKADIKKFEDGPIEFPSVGTAINAALLDYLRHLLELIQNAIRVERERIQAVRDSVDAILYSVMAESSIKLNDDFKEQVNAIIEAKGKDIHSRVTEQHHQEVSA